MFPFENENIRSFYDYKKSIPNSTRMHALPQSIELADAYHGKYGTLNLKKLVTYLPLIPLVADTASLAIASLSYATTDNVKERKFALLDIKSSIFGILGDVTSASDIFFPKGTLSDEMKQLLLLFSYASFSLSTYYCPRDVKQESQYDTRPLMRLEKKLRKVYQHSHQAATLRFAYELLRLLYNQKSSSADHFDNGLLSTYENLATLFIVSIQVHILYEQFLK